MPFIISYIVLVLNILVSCMNRCHNFVVVIRFNNAAVVGHNRWHLWAEDEKKEIIQYNARRNDIKSGLLSQMNHLTLNWAAAHRKKNVSTYKLNHLAAKLFEFSQN